MVDSASWKVLEGLSATCSVLAVGDGGLRGDTCLGGRPSDRGPVAGHDREADPIAFGVLGIEVLDEIGDEDPSVTG